MDRGRSEFDGKWGGEGLGWRRYMETDMQFPTIFKMFMHVAPGTCFVHGPPSPRKNVFFCIVVAGWQSRKQIQSLLSGSISSRI